MNKINFKYAQLWKEFPYFFMISLRKYFGRKSNIKNNKVLIINSCLLGEFCASLPAISNYIQKNQKEIIDLAVSPSIKSMAQRVLGINEVFTIISSYGKKWDKSTVEHEEFPSYKKVIVLRASPDVYKMLKNIRTSQIKTAMWPFLKYSFHLLKSLMFRYTPKQFREISFEMLGYSVTEIKFNQIFYLDNVEIARLNKLLSKYSDKIKIIIHTGSHWPMNSWPSENWVRLIERVNKNYKCILIFIGNSEEDEKNYEYISSCITFETISFIKKMSILETLILLRNADYFIGIDSGPMNMAHLAELKSINILGPGPHMFLSPNNNDVILDKSNGRGFYQRFFKTKNSFISKITVEETYRAFKKLVI